MMSRLITNNEWIVAENYTPNPIEHDVIKNEGGHDMPLLEEMTIRRSWLFY